MSFKPYVIYAVRLPIQRPGYIIRIGTDFYQIITVRHNRKRFTITGAQTTYRLKQEILAAFASLHGNIKLDRIVHLQYLSVETATIDTTLYWGTQPLLSKDVKEVVSTITAPVDAPLEIDRWSYDEAMHLYLDQTGTQTYDIETVEYEVVAYPGTPERPFLHILANGQAIMVEKPQTEETLHRLIRAEVARAKKA